MNLLLDFLAQQGAAEKFAESYILFTISEMTYSEYVEVNSVNRSAITMAFDHLKSQELYKLPNDYWCLLSHRWFGYLTKYNKEHGTRY